MGLFSTTTIINSTTDIAIDNGAVAAATNRVARATDKVAKATDKVAEATNNVASAIGDDRITIGHARYAELYNKGEKLAAAKKYVHSLLASALKAILNSAEPRDINDTSHVYSLGTEGIPTLIFSIAYDDVFFVVDKDTRTADLYMRNNNYNYTGVGILEKFTPIQFDEPLLMNEEDGQVQVSGVEYKKVITIEREYDEVYSNIRETLPRLIFDMINPRQYVTHGVLRSLQAQSDFAYEFEGLIFEYSPNGINLKKSKNGDKRFS